MTVTDSCSTSIISPSTFTAIKNHDISSGLVTSLINLDWTVTPAYCPGLTYYLYSQGTTTNADAIFIKNGNTYEVSTTNSAKIGSYPLELYAEMTGYSGVSESV